MALRIRRYRLVLGVSLLLIATLYHLSRFNTWDVPVLDQLSSLRSQTEIKNDAPDRASRIVATLPPAFAQQPAESTPSLSSLLDFPADATASPSPLTATTSSTAPASTTLSLPPLPPNEQVVQVGDKPPQLVDRLPQDLVSYGHGRVEIEQLPYKKSDPPVHWEAQPEHFPVPEEDLIRLPHGKPRQLPPIQFDFAPESPGEQADRLQKLATIKAAFRHAWSGYRDHAMGHDELKPVSGKSTDPFNGWGATLVDSLDTLWIMNLTDEFDDAVTAVRKIDFTTSLRKDIPVFETTIRYVGGLVSAFDLSGAKYSVLLDKAVELADILLGAFDTPNRMPDTYYLWAPQFASQPHRAKPRVVLAELGSLAVEFTRLAQLTKEDKYYDAIARITDALEAWQMNTMMPGLWPLAVDASGCKKPNSSVLTVVPPHQAALVASEITKPASNASDSTAPPSEARLDDSAKPAQAGAASKRPPVRRQLDDAGTAVADTAHVGTQHPPNAVHADSDEELAMMRTLPPLAPEADPIKVECEPQGLAEEPQARRQTFSIGAQADSTYEYFPKEYLLLGGQVEQYKFMYQDAVKTVRQQLLFRPMNKEEKDILFVGKVHFDKRGDGEWVRSMVYEGTHLSCFAGGMFALGSKVFGIPGDLDIAAKLTEGCIWAYGSTTTGIMPEEFAVVPCDSRTSCAWNVSKWYDVLDPNEKNRIEAVERWNENQQFYLEQSQAEATKARAAAAVAAVVAIGDVPDVGIATPKSLTVDALSKRQINHSPNVDSDVPTRTATTTTTHAENLHDESATDADLPVFTPRQALSHAEFAESRIKEERIPPGFASFTSRVYGLRPEAIESVWIMYRLTGNPHWRRQGWQMFQAIHAHTLTELANSMISDVTSEVPLAMDTMESFWLAETLKYFYLLFSEPSVVSLDEYVLNTEAHPFRRPR